MGAYLRIKESEGDYLWAVAEMALCAPLPPEWQEIRQGPHTTFRWGAVGWGISGACCLLAA